MKFGSPRGSRGGPNNKWDASRPDTVPALASGARPRRCSPRGLASRDRRSTSPLNRLDGNDNYAYVDGPANSTAYAYDGDSNIAYISDPFGAAGLPDTAIAGDGFSNDLAEVLLAHGNATADTANLLYDIVSLFGNFSGSF
jgi:hypothetical protein